MSSHGKPDTRAWSTKLWHSVVAGAAAGISEVCCMYPLDVVKTRLQLQNRLVAGSTNYTGIPDAFRQIVRNEGVLGLYRGILAPILAEAPKRAVKFTCNDIYKGFFISKKTGVLSSYGAAAAGALAGVTEAFVNCPFEVIKVRLQSPDYKALYQGTTHAVSTVVREEGLLTLYKGLEPQLWRNAVWNGAYFGIINQCKAMLPVAKTDGQELMRNFVAGTLAGGLATTANTPLDVVKSRMQNARVAGKYVWSLPSLVTIGREEGFRALYSGYAARLLRLGPGGGVMLVIYDRVQRWLQQ